MRKRMFALFMAMLMCLSLLPVGAVADASVIDSGECGENLTWTLDENGLLTISGEGAMEDYSSGSGAPWSSYSNRASSVVIGDGVTSIGNYAFFDLYKLKSITFGKDVQSIGSAALKATDLYLTHIYFKGSMPAIADDAFSTNGPGDIVTAFAFYPAGDDSYANAGNYGARKLIWLPDGDAEDILFSGSCGANITWGLTRSGVLKLSGSGEMGDFTRQTQPWKDVCFGILSVDIPDSVTSIGAYAFSGCENITELVIPDSVTSIGAYAFSGCENITELVIPDSVTSIGAYAFSGCDSLTSVTIPDSVTSIGDYAFSSCYRLTSVTLPKGITAIEANTFSGTNLSEITIPDGVQSIDDYAFDNCRYLESITLPDGLQSIGRDAFGDCFSLTSVTIPSSVTSIGIGAFYRCSDLTSATFEGNAPTTFGNDVFYSCGASGFKIVAPDNSTWKGNAYDAEAGTWNGYPIEFYYVEIIADGTCGENLTWTLDENGLLTISGEGEMEDYSSISYSGPYATSAPWGQYYASIKSVVIEDGVTSIGSDAFAYCSGLTSVTIPDSVQSIGSSAFDGTALYNNSSNWENGVLYLGKYLIVAKTNITSCSVKAGTLCIADSAFNRCSSLTSVTIPDSVTSIGGSAFSACIGITSVDIPDSVTSIGREAFYYCSSLTSVTIPDSVQSIGSAAFYYCYGLTSAEFEGNAPTTFGTNVFYHCADGFKILAPDNDTWKGEAYNAEEGTWNGYPIEFYHAGHVYTAVVTAPTCTEKGYTTYTCSCGDSYVADEIDALGHDFVDHECTRCDANDYVATGTCGENLTWTLDSDGLLTISGEGAMTDYLYSSAPWFKHRNSFNSVVIGDGVTSIGNYAFYDCFGITSVTIPDSVTSIGYYAFYYCSSLTSVTIGSGVQSIGNSAFSYCSSLTSVTIGSGVQSIGNSAFSCCYSLESVTIGSGVQSIGNSAFFGCSNLTSVTIPDSVESIGDYAFRDCTALTSVTIGSGVQSIGNSAFSGCGSLTSVTIPDSVESIGDYAFCDCGSLTSINVSADNESYASVDGVLFSKDLKTIVCYPAGKGETYDIPDGVQSIGRAAFSGCSNLTSVTIPDSVTSIGDYAFNWCSGLTSVTIPDSVESIGYRAFNNCTGLTSVTIPDSVTSIGSYAFGDCTGLTSVTIPGSVGEVAYGVFELCDNLTDVVISEGITTISIGAFASSANLQVISLPSTIEDFSGAFAGDRLSTVYYNGSIGNWNEKFLFTYSDYAFKDADIICTDGTISPESVTAGRISYPGSGYWAILDDTLYINSSGVINASAQFSAYEFSKVKISGNATEIGEGVFSGCTGLTEISIPKSVKTIGTGAFEGCTGLTDVYYDGTRHEWYNIDINWTDNEPLSHVEEHFATSGQCGDNATWVYDEAERTLTISGTGEMDGRTLSNYSTDKLVIGEGITGVNYLPDADSYEFPSTLERIDDGEFSPYNLYSYNGTVAEWNDVDIPDDFKGIAVKCSDGYANVNYSCGDNATWSYENGVITVSGTGEISDRNWRFLKDEVTALVINEGIQGINELAFGYGFSKLAEISFPDSLEYMGDTNPIFDGTPYAENPDNYIGGVLYIGKWAIACDHTEANIVIRDGTVGIASDAFWELGLFDGTEIESVRLPEGIKFIGNDAFEGCDKLVTINLPDSITSIGSRALHDCGIKELRLPAGVTSYDGYNILYWTQLEKLTIPNTVKKIGAGFLLSAADNFEIYYEGTEEEWNAIEIDPDNAVLLNAVIHFVPTVHVHSYVAAVTEPTCTEGGYTTYTCSCGESYVGDETASLGHDFHNLRCSRCGESQVTETARQITEAVNEAITETVNQVVETFQTIGTAISNAFTNAINAIRSIFRF